MAHSRQQPLTAAAVNTPRSLPGPRRRRRGMAGRRRGAATLLWVGPGRLFAERGTCVGSCDTRKL